MRPISTHVTLSVSMDDGFEWIWDLQNKTVAFPFQAGRELLYQIDLLVGIVPHVHL